MRYPIDGGFKAFLRPLLETADVRLRERCVEIDARKRQVRFDTGRTIAYQTLVSTVPLPDLVKLIKGVPESVRQMGESLKATSIDLISVGFRRKISSALWFYIYDEDIIASRAHSPSLKAESNAPPGCSSLQFECYSRGPVSQFNSERLKENVLYALAKMKIAKPEDIEVLDHRFLPYGNVIFDLGMEARREEIRGYLKSTGIETCGRFGAWDYLWSNQSLMSGYNSVR
jgi:protoporphyrinogen oxidase